MKAAILVIPFAAAIVVGCQAPQSTRRVEGATTAALTAHRFAPPTFVAGKKGAVWAFASRPQSQLSLETACIRLSADGQAGVKITSYQYVGSDWAIVGPLFDQEQSQQEAADIQREIYSKLSTQ